MGKLLDLVKDAKHDSKKMETLIHQFHPLISSLARRLNRTEYEDAVQNLTVSFIAKAQLGNIVLSLVSNAERSYSEYSKAGEIKRSEVIAEIYKQYPILSKVADQEELLKYIDDLIDEALKTVREIVRMEESENG